MPELARRLASRLRQFVGERRRARRAAVSLPITVSLAGSTSNGYKRQASVEGHTMDISATGLGLVVPAIRIRDSYLTGEDRRLFVKLELTDDDAVEMQVKPVRYESLDEEGYLIGVHITEISEAHQATYIHHIAKLLK